VPLVPRAASALLIPVLLVPCRWFPYCWFRAAGSAPLIPVPLVPCRWFRAADSRAAGSVPLVPRCRAAGSAVPAALLFAALLPPAADAVDTVLPSY